MATQNWQLLRERRKRLGVTQTELASVANLSHQAVHRRELPPDHPDHVRMTDAELLQWCTWLLQIVEGRTKLLTPAEVLE